MSVSGHWRVITPKLLEELPDQPGVFEIGNLVRTVLFVGAARDTLAVEIHTVLATARLASRAHCLRFEVAENAEDRAQARLAAFRQSHGGRLPNGHRERHPMPAARPAPVLRPVPERNPLPPRRGSAKKL